MSQNPHGIIGFPGRHETKSDEGQLAFVCVSTQEGWCVAIKFLMTARTSHSGQTRNLDAIVKGSPGTIAIAARYIAML